MSTQEERCLLHLTRSGRPGPPPHLIGERDQQLEWRQAQGQWVTGEGRNLDSKELIALLFDADGILTW